jgi:hypothetical protein
VLSEYVYNYMGFVWKRKHTHKDGMSLQGKVNGKINIDVNTGERHAQPETNFFHVKLLQVKLVILKLTI